MAEFQSAAHELKERAKVFGCNTEAGESEGWMEAGTWVADAYFYQEVLPLFRNF